MNATQYEIEDLAASSDKFIDHCLDNPNNNALAALGKVGNFACAAGIGGSVDR